MNSRYVTSPFVAEVILSCKSSDSEGYDDQ